VSVTEQQGNIFWQGEIWKRSYKWDCAEVPLLLFWQKTQWSVSWTSVLIVSLY
jgi:hypothetical protein